MRRFTFAIALLALLASCELQQNSLQKPNVKAWSADSTYSIGDEVTYDGFTFQSLIDSNKGVVPCVVIKDPNTGITFCIWNSATWEKLHDQSPM